MLQEMHDVGSARCRKCTLREASVLKFDGKADCRQTVYRQTEDRCGARMRTTGAHS